jgi:hypothetical protein
MDALEQANEAYRSSPRLWIERLCIFSHPEPAGIFRDIPFRRGLNLVWAREPAEGTATGIEAAGHGVGKTSLCLLLRFCLGEASKPIQRLREDLRQAFPEGGVVAVLHLDGEPYTFCRYFNPHRDGKAAMERALESIWEREDVVSEAEFLALLAERMMALLSSAVIPETGQAIEWRHVLAWLSRDQGASFKHFYDWRESQGLGLSRSRQDPPFVLRSVLGMLLPEEASLLAELARLEGEVNVAEQRVADLESKPALVRLRLESNLRFLVQGPDDLPIRTADLFADCVEARVKKLADLASSKVAELEVEIVAWEQKLSDVRHELKLLENPRRIAEVQYELADAARRQDEDAYRVAAGKLAKLRSIAGRCEHGDVDFQQCEYVKSQIASLSAAVSIQSGADQRALRAGMEKSAQNAVQALRTKETLEQQANMWMEKQDALLKEQRKLRLQRDTQVVEADRCNALLAELERWEKQAGSEQARAEIEKARQQVTAKKQLLASTRTKLAQLHQQKGAREKRLEAELVVLAGELFQHRAAGNFDPRDEERPFRLSVPGCAAFQVLEVLLGDLACLADSSKSNSGFPGFLIHDCPREADMGPHLYEHFLLLVHTLEHRQGAGKEPPFQYVVTTTTPPPLILQDKSSYLVLELDPASNDGLLFRKRLSQVDQRLAGV